MWRPKGWRRPYNKSKNRDYAETVKLREAFETGADAMLNAVTLALLEKKLKVVRGKGYLTLVSVG